MNRVSSFEDLIAPVKTREFLESYWEKKPLHLARNQSGAFDDLFSLQDVDRWLTFVRSDFSDSVLLTPPAGSDTGYKRFRPQDLKIDAVYEYFAKGYSVVLNHLEKCWPPISRLVQTLGKTFFADVGANVYITPKGSKTFPIHVDGHDVFVLQVYGEKAWQLHELRLTPVDSARLAHANELSFTEEWGRERVDTPLLTELRMQPGDILYIPRGMPHGAVAKDTTSLHLTISVTPLYWTDFLKAAVEQSHVYTPELRRALPMGLLNDPEVKKAMHLGFLTAMEAFQNHASFEETLAVITRSRIRAQGFPSDGHLAELDDLAELKIESEVEIRENILCSVEQEDDFSHIHFGSRTIRSPGQLHRALEFIRDHQRFTVAAIPDLDEQSKLVLVRRLIREGLLRFAAEQPKARDQELAVWIA